MCHLLLVVLFFVLILEISTGKSVSNNAAIPRLKNKKVGLLSIGQGMLHRLIRETKINFCSDLEGLTLQLTRPTEDALTMLEIEQITDILNNEYDNPQLLVGLLVKFSRKFAEPNVYTKIKTLLSLHRIMDNSKTNAQIALSKAVHSLQKEVDEKVDSNFFAIDSIEQTAEIAENVAEIEAVELARVYAAYVFDFLFIKGDTHEEPKRKTKNVKAVSFATSGAANRAERLMALLEQGETVEVACRRLAGPLGKQCLDGIKSDRKWAVESLRQLYEKAVITDRAILEGLELLLGRFDATFSIIRRLKDSSRSTDSRSADPDMPVVLDREQALSDIRNRTREGVRVSAQVQPSVSKLPPSASRKVNVTRNNTNQRSQTQLRNSTNKAPSVKPTTELNRKSSVVAPSSDKNIQ